MTDRQYPPRRADSHGNGPATTYRRGPEPQPEPQPAGETTPEKPKPLVNVVQISAGAGASVTSAVAASYFGVGGTIAGAAFGSVVSTVASSLYTESLNKARKVVQTSTAVVVQRYPGDVPQADSISRMNGPAGVPVADSLNRVGREDTRHVDVDHIQVPVGDETQVMGGGYDDGTQVMRPYDDSTQVMPPATASRSGGYQQQSRRQTQDGAYHTSRTYQGGQSSSRRPAPAARALAADTPLWQKPGFLMTALTMATFLIALFLITGTETALGHPISGKSSGSGTSVGKLTSSITKSESDDSDDDSTTTPTESATPTDEATATETPTETSTDSETVAPTETADPQSTTTDQPTSTDTYTDDGTGTGDTATDGSSTQNTDGTGDTTGDGTGDTGVDSQSQDLTNP